MRVYRLSSSVYSNDLSGEGARLYGGRWNLKGTRAVYTSQSIALATLEFLVHLDREENIPITPMKLLIIEVSDTMPVYVPDDLPSQWNQLELYLTVQEKGSAWLDQGHGVIQVPSVPVPAEFNYILNPKHPDFNSMIKIIEEEDWNIDPRLVKD